MIEHKRTRVGTETEIKGAKKLGPVMVWGELFIHIYDRAKRKPYIYIRYGAMGKTIQYQKDIRFWFPTFSSTRLFSLKK